MDMQPFILYHNVHKFKLKICFYNIPLNTSQKFLQKNYIQYDTMLNP